MHQPLRLAELAALCTIVLPALSAVLIGLLALRARPPRERTTSTVALTGAVSTLACSLLLVHAHQQRGAPLFLDFGAWFEVHGYAFRFALVVDGLSLLMLVLSSSIVTLIARFSIRYLHREPGYHRFFALLASFTSGMSLLVLSGSYDLLFAGWEIVGVTSLLLIAFFNDRRGPIAGAVRAMVCYRVADVGLLAAGVLLHHFLGSAEFEVAFGAHAFPRAATALPSAGCTWVGLALLLAVMGKSAQFPLSPWLPRAMEGPTPSSALFYGALSVHAGVYLLLRSAPILESSPIASAAVGVVGALSAISATLTGRTQSDAKSVLAYATITQVGLMLVAISLHLWTFVLVHMVAHACLRLFQLLRAPSALRDAQELQAALQRRPAPRPGLGARILPESVLTPLYHVARRGFFLTELADHYVVAPLLALARYFDRLERLATSGRSEAADREHAP